MNKDKKVTKEFVEKVENGFQSRIFTQTEKKEVQRRLNGKKKNYRIWQRAKPKVKEIIEWSNNHIEELEKLIK